MIPAPAGWPTLAPAALHGLAGAIVDALGPDTEADPVTLLGAILTMAGNAAGAKAHIRVGGDLHPARLNLAIVGKSARARKGSGFSMVRMVMAYADGPWCAQIQGGFGSGEAVVDAVRDSDDEHPAERDRRVLVREGEFSRILRVAERDGSTLSPIIREAWDGARLAVRTRKSTVVATDAHISVLADITLEELRRSLSSTEAANGFANRFMFLLARRARKLPSGGNVDDEVVRGLGVKVAEVLRFAKTAGPMHRTAVADELWTAIYDEIDDEVPDLFGSVTARSEAHMLRLQVAYALLDRSRFVDVEHVEAAAAFWHYAEASARYIFSWHTGNDVADRILVALVAAGEEGLDGTEQNKLFGGHVPSKRLTEAREMLETRGLAVTVNQSTDGRPRVRTFVAEKAEQAKKPLGSDLAPLNRLSPQHANGTRERARAAASEAAE